jgi:hypothetical protein
VREKRLRIGECRPLDNTQQWLISFAGFQGFAFGISLLAGQAELPISTVALCHGCMHTKNQPLVFSLSNWVEIDGLDEDSQNISSIRRLRMPEKHII